MEVLNAKSKLTLKKLKIRPYFQKKKPKPRVKFHTKTKTQSSLETIVEGFDSLAHTKKYYINLKENQIMNLFTAIKIRAFCVKRRYASLAKSINLLQKKRNLLPASLKLIPSPIPNLDISPITLIDTAFLNTSSFSNFTETKLSPNKQELKRLLDSIQEATINLIEINFSQQEKLRNIEKQKQALVLKFGNLYTRKQILASSRESLKKTLENNKQLSQSLAMLKETLFSCQDRAKSQKFRLQEKSDLQYRVFELSERVSKKKSFIELEKKKVSEVESSNLSKESYLKELLSLKQKILVNSEKMKDFDYTFSFTKKVLSNAMPLYK